MDLLIPYLDVLVDREAWRMVAQEFATNRERVPAELSALHSAALRIANSILDTASLKNSQSASPPEIASLLQQLKNAKL